MYNKGHITNKSFRLTRVFLPVILSEIGPDAHIHIPPAAMEQIQTFAN